MKDADPTRNMKKCKIGLLNARSVRNKSGLIREMIIDEELQILACTETWLKDGDEAIIDEMCPPGYTFVGQHRPEEKSSRGGGIGFVMRAGRNARSRNHDYQTFEAVTLFISADSVMPITVVYRPPPSSDRANQTKLFLQEIELMLSDLCTKYSHVCVVGDFNIHYGKEPLSDAFDLILQSLGLCQLVSQPTHTHGNVLDLILVPEQHRVSSISIDQSHNISDHSLITFAMTMKTDAEKPSGFWARSIRRIQMDAFANGVREGLERISSNEETITAMNSVLSTALDAHAPARKVHPKGTDDKGWYDDETHEARKKRRRLERQYRKSKLEIHRQLWREQCKRVVQMIKEKKKMYYHRKLTNATSKEAFSLIDRLLAKDKARTLPSEEDKTALAERFSKFFVEKISKIRSALDANQMHDPEPPNSPCTSSMNNFSPVTEEEVKKLILSSASKSCSLDPVPTSLIKNPELLAVLTPYITTFINHSLTTGIVPESLKVAQVTPRLKKPGLDRDVLKNYRPVSNIPFMSKLLEKVVVDRLHKYLSENGLHDKFQSAYKPKHSTETAMLKTKTDLDRIMDDGDAALMVMLDLSAAFDTVDHSALLARVERDLGIKGVVLDWLRSYLSDRTQYVAIGEERSQPSSLNVGVPQGSVMGPILFLLYILPLQRITDSFPGISRHSYADDIQLYCRLSSNNPEECMSSVAEMNTCIDRVRTWLLKNKLMINDAKTEVQMFGNKRAMASLKDLQVNITVGESSIAPSTSCRNLGIILDPQLKMDKQVTAATKAAYYHLHRIRRIRPFLTRAACEKAIFANVTSRLDYGNALLLGCTDTTKRRLQLVQNHAARVLMCQRDRRAHITPVLKHLHWLPIDSRTKYKNLVLIHNAMHRTESPAYLCDFISIYSPLSSLRSAADHLTLNLSVFKSSTGQNTFTHKAFKLWNELPLTMRAITCSVAFKRQLKTHLFKQAYRD